MEAKRPMITTTIMISTRVKPLFRVFMSRALTLCLLSFYYVRAQYLGDCMVGLPPGAFKARMAKTLRSFWYPDSRSQNPSRRAAEFSNPFQTNYLRFFFL